MTDVAKIDFGQQEFDQYDRVITALYACVGRPEGFRYFLEVLNKEFIYLLVMLVM